MAAIIRIMRGKSKYAVFVKVRNFVYRPVYTFFTPSTVINIGTEMYNMNKYIIIVLFCVQGTCFSPYQIFIPRLHALKQAHFRDCPIIIMRLD